jgi:hypothetical protein
MQARLFGASDPRDALIHGPKALTDNIAIILRFQSMADTWRTIASTRDKNREG